MQKKWIIRKDDEAIVNNLVKELNISELTAKVLYHRGITNVKDAEIFLDPETKQEFNDPFLMKDMKKAVDRIRQAIDNREKIVVYGDYDVDGMTSSAIMLRALKKFGAAVEFYIPKRQEGYGFNIPALHKIADGGVNLIISVDCGISNVNEIEEVKDRLDVIVTDHHLPSGPIENAVAVIDPHHPDCPYPDKNLCGAGVAFKLCQALNMNINNIDYKNYTTDIDLAALATVADIVPLVGENRKIVRLGLNQMSDTKNIGLAALIKASDIAPGKKLSSGHLGFKLGPRLNAAGRLKAASKGVALLISEDIVEAENIAQELEAGNAERKLIEQKIIKEANIKYQNLRKERGGDMSSIIVADEKWHPGVIGLAASRLLEKYYLPTIVISIQGELARASCRSIDALHMKNTLDYFRDYFTQYGGHAAAAGFTIRTKDIDEFRNAFDNYVKENLKEEDFIPVQNIDALVPPSKLTVKLADEMEKLEPFGIQNPYPVFASRNVQGLYPKTMGRDNSHLSFYIKSDEGKNDIRAVSWGNAAFLPLVENELVDIIFEPERSEFNGNVSVQCTIKSIEPSRENASFPDRNAMSNIYKFLWRYADKNRLRFMPYDICKFNVEFKNSDLANKNPQLNSTYTMLCAVQVFEELGLIQFDDEGKNFIMPKASRNFELNESRFCRINSNH